ncbi:MAG: hypothetical protein LUH15_20050 [Tannerellaceae bacterium]|nr:hypothetical protein [Tannerellaceae bacterium]
MAKEITLTLEGQIYPVLRCTYGFNREVDYRGRPTTGLLGGDIQLEVESTGDDYLWEKLLGKKPRPVSGKVEIVDSAKMTPVRILEWYDGYIYAVEKRMSSLFAIPMIQQIRITTERLDINRDIKLDRRFPQTYGFWWEEYKEPELVVVTEETSEPEEGQTPEITAVSWLSEEKDTLTIIPRDLEETVTLHVETSGFGKPGNDDEDVLIRIKDEEGETLLNYNTHPNQEGEINLKLSIHDILSERHKNPTEYLKQHPELKLSFFAAWEQTPDEAQVATLEKEKPQIITARWQNEKENPLTIIPGGEYNYVGIYIEAANFETDEEDKCPEILYIQIVDEDNNRLYEDTRSLSEKGSCTIKNFDLYSDIDTYLSENGLPALTTRPFSYALRAWLESNPDEPKEAVIQEEVQCTVQFKRPKNYKGDFLFDWYREGDDGDPLNKWYRELLTNELFFKNYINHNYIQFKESWKTKHPKYKENYMYAVPSMTIVPGFTASIRLKLTVEKPVNKVDFKITGGDPDTFSLSFNTLQIQKTGIYYHEEDIQITCNKVFNKQMFLEVYAGNEKVGQLEFIPNHEPFKIDIAIIPVRLMDIKGNTLEAPKMPSADIKRMKELFQQLYIFPNIHVLDTLDCARDRYSFKVGEESKKFPLLTAFLIHSNGGIITNDNNIRIKKHPSLPKDFHDCQTYEYLSKFAQIECEKTGKAELFNKSFKVFVFPIHNYYNESTLGVATIKKNGDKVTISDNVYLYKVTDQYNPYVTVHEVLHALGLEHPKDNKMFEGKYHWVFKNFYITDNIMDYAKPDDTKTHLERSKKLRGMWKWQYQMVHKFANDYYPKKIDKHRYDE